MPRHAQLNGNGKFVPIGTFLSSYNISSFAEISPRVEFFPRDPGQSLGIWIRTIEIMFQDWQMNHLFKD